MRRFGALQQRIGTESSLNGRDECVGGTLEAPPPGFRGAGPSEWGTTGGELEIALAPGRQPVALLQGDRQATGLELADVELERRHLPTHRISEIAGPDRRSSSDEHQGLGRPRAR